MKSKKRKSKRVLYKNISTALGILGFMSLMILGLLADAAANGELPLKAWFGLAMITISLLGVSYAFDRMHERCPKYPKGYVVLKGGKYVA